MLKYSEFKEWLPICNMEFYNRMEPIFMKEPFRDKRANRIYLYSKLENDYKLQPEIKDFLNKNGYRVIDEIDGTCIQTSGDSRAKRSPVKIGKILSKLEQPNLLMEFTNRRTLHIKDTDEYITVISRHPYDVLGVSTRRNWSSCIDISGTNATFGKQYYWKLQNLVKAGCLVAYLIRKDDKNIRNPIARINFSLMEIGNPNGTFSKTENELRIYESHGKCTDAFISIVRNWITETNKQLKPTLFQKVINWAKS